MINTDNFEKTKFSREEMITEMPDLLSFLQSRYSIYSFLGFVMYNKPDLRDFKELNFDHFIKLLTSADNCSEIPGLSELQEVIDCKAGCENTINSLKLDFQNLFEGPGKLLAPPWESVYLSEEKLMFDEQTMEVRELYRRYGLQISNAGTEPDDHIGLELQFMAFLSRETLETLKANDLVEFQNLIKTQCYFLQEHILKWVRLFAKTLYQGASTSYYKGLALFIPWYVENDAETIISWPCLNTL